MTDVFDELHSVSDLHLGGEAGFQIFDLGDKLAALIDSLRTSSPGRRVALVLNGDIVDFLAEPGATYFDTTLAWEKLERIIDDDAFTPVWEALKAFVRAPGCHLVLVLGNHDVELALPRVRAELAQYLCGPDEGARGRLVFAMDGAGYACRVGNASVLCLHGNEVDPWNVVDYERLRAISAASNRSLQPPSWVPNGGTRLVIDIMNSVKRRFRWVDLLKPEGEGVVPLLIAMDEERRDTARQAALAAIKMVRDRVGRRLGLLGPEDQETLELDAEAHLEGLLNATAGATEVSTGTDDEKRLLLEIEAAFERRLRGATYDAVGDETLGVGDVLSSLGRVDKVEVALRTLRSLVSGFTGFNPTHPDRDFNRLDEAVGPDIDFLIAGHTHMAKALIRRGGRSYFNSGTWIKLINFRKWLADPTVFRTVWAQLDGGTMDSLDALRIPLDGAQQRFVERHPHVVTVSTDAGGVVRGKLRRVEPETGSLGEVVRTLPEPPAGG